MNASLHLPIGKLCFWVLLLLLPGLAPLPKALCDSAPVPSAFSQVTDKNSPFYLLSNDTSLDANRPYHAMVKAIDRFGRAQDWNGLAKLADYIERTWGRQADTRGYFALMDDLTYVMRPANLGQDTDQERSLLTQKCVLATLAHPNPPLNILAGLLPRLVSEERWQLRQRPFNTAEWVELRRTRAPLWLQTRQRLKLLIDPNYDMTSLVYINWPLDIETITHPNSPASRQKIKARNAFMEANSAKVRGRSNQAFVRSLDEIFSRQAENEIISYYSQPPYEMPQLRHLLSIYNVGPVAQKRILIEVAVSIPPISQTDAPTVAK